MKRTYHFISYMICCGALLSALAANAQKERFTLERCVEMAQENNVRIKNAKLEIDAAEEDRKYAFTQVFPQISAMGAGFVGAKDLMRGEMEVPQMGAMPLSMIKKGRGGHADRLAAPVYGRTDSECQQDGQTPARSAPTPV